MISRDSVLDGYAFTVRTDTSINTFRVIKSQRQDGPEPTYFAIDETAGGIYMGRVVDHKHYAFFDFTMKSLDYVRSYDLAPVTDARGYTNHPEIPGRQENIDMLIAALDAIWGRKELPAGWTLEQGMVTR